MLFLSKWRHKSARTDEGRRKRRADGSAANALKAPLRARARRSSLPVAAFLLMTAAVSFICFYGQSRTLPPVGLNQISGVSIISQHNFSYPSALLTKRQKQQRELLVPTVIRIDLDSLPVFERTVSELVGGLNALADALRGIDDAALREEEADAFSKTFADAHNGFKISREQVLTFLRETSGIERRRLLDSGARNVAQILREGVYSPKAFGLSEGEKQDFLLSLKPDADGQRAGVRTIEEARARLQRTLPTTSKSRVNEALFEIMQQGIVPNVAPDAEETQARRRAAAERVPDVVVTVVRGQAIVRAGQLVGEEDMERKIAYQNYLSALDAKRPLFDTAFLHSILLTAVLLLCAAIYLKVGMPTRTVPRAKTALMSFVLLAALALSRGFIELDGSAFVLNHPALQGAFSPLAPSVFAALLVSVLIGTRPAVLVCLMASIFGGVMLGNSIEAFVGGLLVSLITIRLTQGVHQRRRIVRAGLLSGLTIAGFALIFGLYHQTPLGFICVRMGIDLALCALAAVLAIGLFPIFEFFFKITTDIRLLELTDFNHPLLRRLQIDAPGTYHHSLMVANLAERAADEIGANPIACRVGALFHDIGKIDRPEYFTENQRDGINPHNGDITPPMSALIIKSHVKEGLDIARHAKLPQIVLEAIGSHHGTGIIRYFFDKANRALHEPQKNAPLDTVDEATYRYEGPRPHSKEVAIIQLADSVEAASRSLKKATPQSVEELVERIVREKLLDGQLDDSPLTIHELSRIKQSFVFTLLTMLHGRVAYAPQRRA